MNFFEKEHEGIVKLVVGGVLGLLVLLGITSSFYTVDPNEEAVVIRLGKFYETNPPGLHFKLPFGIDKKYIVKTRLMHTEEFGFRNYRGRDNNLYSTRDSLNKESLMLTGDLNVADVEWVVLYRVSDPFKYIFRSRNPKRNIRDVSESIMRRVVGDRLVSDVLTTGRVQVANDAKKLMQDVLDEYDIGISISSVKLQDVNPPEKVKPSFNEVNEAKQEQEQVINQAEKAYNKVIPKARGKAEETIARAQGKAKARINRAKGEAEKFFTVLKSYKKAPSITKKRIYLETMEHLFSRFERVTILDPEVKGVLPVFKQGLNLNKNN